MAYLKKKGKTWYIVRQENRKKKWLTTKTTNKEEARIVFADWLRTRRAEQCGLPTGPKDVPWEEYVQEYLEHQSSSGKARQTILRDQIVFKHVVRLVTIGMLSDWTPVRLDEYKNRRNEDGVKPATINKEIAVIRAALKEARRRNYRVRPELTFKMVQDDGSRPYFFSDKELEQLVSEPDPYWRTVVYLGFYAGLRKGEMLNLGWEDVNFKEDVVSIASKPNWKTKTASSARKVPLHPILRQHLEALRQLNSEVKKVVPWDRQSHQFSMHFAKLLRRKGIARGSLHTLRHSFASCLARADVNMKKVMDLMGHKSLATTQIYSHLQPSTLATAVAKLPGLEVLRNA